MATEFKTIEADAMQYSIGADEDVFVFCNPFDGTILSKVLDNITTSARKHPRKVLIIYYNPRWDDVITQRRDFAQGQDFIFGGYQFTMYSNCD